MRLLPTVRLRLGEPDWERYGDQWWTYDEAALVRLPVQELIAIEGELRRELGLTLQGAMLGYRQGAIDGTLALLWVARRLGGVTEPLAEFAPLVMLAEAEVPGSGDVDPPASPSSPSPESAEA